jgi:c(7)-type cytochrome triheme protein
MPRSLTERLTARALPALGGLLAVLLVALVVSAAGVRDAQAEYGDVVLNNASEKNGVRGVVFPHWFHRIRYNCKVCHADLGFQFQAGKTEITMRKIVTGEQCGACHNGQIAWSSAECDLCHLAKPGTPTSVDIHPMRTVKP